MADLVNAPFHRAALLGSYGSAGSGFAESVGAGSSGGTTASYYQTIDLADASKGGADNQMVAYPYSGQADVPASWVNNEPQPGAGVRRPDHGLPGVGAGHQHVAGVQCRYVHHHRRRRHQRTLREGGCAHVGHVELRARAGHLRAARPLAAKTRYNVTVSGTLNGQGVNLNWSFTTL